MISRVVWKCLAFRLPGWVADLVVKTIAIVVTGKGGYKRASVEAERSTLSGQKKANRHPFGDDDSVARSLSSSETMVGKSYLTRRRSKLPCDGLASLNRTSTNQAFTLGIQTVNSSHLYPGK